MATEPLTPTAENDLLIARAVGYHKPFVLHDRKNTCYYTVEEYPANLTDRYVGCDNKYKKFSPTTCMDDAKKAAEAVGLFDPEHGAAHLSQVDSGTGKIWYIRFYQSDDDDGWIEATAATMELAICEAILASADENHEKEKTEA